MTRQWIWTDNTVYSNVLTGWPRFDITKYSESKCVHFHKLIGLCNNKCDLKYEILCEII